MLSDSLKKTIRQIHKHVADNLTDYRPRSSQNYLVAEIAKTLAGEYHKSQRICVIEAAQAPKIVSVLFRGIALSDGQEKEAGDFYGNRCPTRAVN